MVLILTLCCLAGTVIGLRYNIKMIGHVGFVATFAWTVAVLTGTSGIAYAIPGAIGTIVCLQVGYCVSMIFASIGNVDFSVSALARARRSVAAQQPSFAQDPRGQR